MTHNYVAELTQLPTVMKSEGYSSKEDYNKRFKKTPQERAELFALKLAYKKQLKKEYGADWKQALKNASKPFRQFNKSIQSGAKTLVQWN